MTAAKGAAAVAVGHVAVAAVVEEAWRLIAVKGTEVRRHLYAFSSL